MSPALLLPAALGALAALLIPVLIHLARRTEARPVTFAALRWLDPRPRPRRRVRIDELLLLAVRLLLLALLPLFLAQPVLWNVDDDRRVIALAPGIDPETVAIDPGDRAVWLTDGFPTLTDKAPARPVNVISLVRQLDAELPPSARLELVVPAVLDGVDAERPRLSRAVGWRVVPGPVARPPRAAPLPRLTIRHDARGREAARYLRAAAIAWAAEGAPPAVDIGAPNRPLGPGATHLAWLATAPLPDPVLAWIARGGTVLLSRDAPLVSGDEPEVAWRDEAGEPLATAGRVGRGRVVRFVRAVEPAAMSQLVEPDFPDALARLLVPTSAPARVAAADHAPLTVAAPYPRPPFDLRPWVALLIALLFAVERWMATRPNRMAGR